MTENLARVAAGIPTGGQFASHDRPDAAATLDVVTRDASLTTPLTSVQMKSLSSPAGYFLNKRDAFILDPPYQRGSVWDDTRRRNLIRSMLMGLPVGSIVVNHRGYNVGPAFMAVVDGKQRIEALRAVADGLLPIPAVWVDARFRGQTQMVDIDGQTIEAVIVDSGTHPFMAIIEDFPLPTLRAEVKTKAEKAAIFMLVNFGGVEQTEADRARAEKVSATK